MAKQRREQNQMFQTNQKQFYRNLNTKQLHNTTPENLRLPTLNDLTIFWKNVWEKEETHNKGTSWATKEKQRNTNTNQMADCEITREELRTTIRKTHNWKAPGCDKLHNFWLKRFTSTHEQILKCLNHILKHPGNTPEFFTQGVTYLIPKTSEPSTDPSKYRPITCLPTMYKVLTSILTEKIYRHIYTNNLMTEEQKGCRKKAQGCKEQIIIDNSITRNCKKRKGELHVAYIDYQKAFDSVPHTWLQEVLNIYKIDPILTTYLQSVIEKWNTNLQLITQHDNLNIGNIKIRKGIFQGDALSPLWFCLAINPLSVHLNTTPGFTIKPTKEKLTHLIYMDDIKLYAGKKEHLNESLNIVCKFTNDIRMKLGIEKCKINTMKGGKWTNEEHYDTTDNKRITHMTEEEVYKYLGILQTNTMKEEAVKTQVKQSMLKRIRQILKSKLSGLNTTKAVNTYAIPVTTYTYGITKWTNTELEDLNRSIRTAFTKHRKYHPKSSQIRFNLPRKFGGRGIIDLKNQYYKQIIKLRTYLHGKANTSNLIKAITQIDKNLTPLNLNNQLGELQNQIQDNKTKIDIWKGKVLHGKHINMLQTEDIDEIASNAWLTKTDIFPETEAFTIAIQDKVISTRNYLKHITKQKIENEKCRICNTTQENIEHIISGCTVLAPVEYTKRHNLVVNIIHQSLVKQIRKGHINIPYYKYQPNQVENTATHTLYYDRTIITDKPIPCNRPDIVFIDREKNKTTIIDIAVPLATNIGKKFKEKLAKYQPLAFEIKEMWKQDVEIVPVIIGPTGQVPITLKKSLTALKIYENTFHLIQKAVILEACSIVRKYITSSK